MTVENQTNDDVYAKRAEKKSEKPQDTKKEQKDAPTSWLNEGDLKALESKYTALNDKNNTQLKPALEQIAKPREQWGLGKEFIQNVILRPSAQVPEQAIITLSKELEALKLQEATEKLAVLSEDELKQLETLFTGVNTTTKDITNFFAQQKEEFTTVGEVMNKTPEQEKLLEWFREKVAKELIGKYPNLKNDADLLQNLSVSTLDWYTGRVNNRIATTKWEETQIQQNNLLNVPLFAPKDAVLTATEQQKLNTVLDQINSTLAPKSGGDTQALQFSAFSAQDFHNMLDTCVTGAGDVKTFSKEQTPALKAKQVSLGKELDGFIEGFVKAPKGSQTMETIATVSKKVFDNLSKVGEWMKDYIENNFGTFETIFAIPLIGPFLKELFVGKKGEEADRYKSAKWVYEKKLATLTAGEQVVGTAIAEKYKDLDKDQSDTHDGELQKKLIAQPWFAGLYTPPTDEKAPLSAEQNKGKNTQDALKKFNDTAYLNTLFDADAIAKLTADKKIAESDPLYGKDVKAYLLTTMYIRLGNTEDAASKFAQDRIKEFTQDTPSDQLKADFALYAEGRLWKICGEQKVSFAWPMDIVNALTFDLLKDSDQAVIAKLRPTVGTAPATTPAVPATVNAPASAPATTPKPVQPEKPAK